MSGWSIRRVSAGRIAATFMRSARVDHARSRNYQKRGGAMRQVSLDEALQVSQDPGRDLVALDEALTAVANVDPRKGQVVELRFFGGLTVKKRRTC